MNRGISCTNQVEGAGRGVSDHVLVVFATTAVADHDGRVTFAAEVAAAHVWSTQQGRADIGGCVGSEDALEDVRDGLFGDHHAGMIVMHQAANDVAGPAILRLDANRVFVEIAFGHQRLGFKPQLDAA